jgi:hypothetical protein
VWNSVATSVGFTPVYRARPSIAQPDYTSECLAAMRAGAQVLAMAFDGPSIRRVAAACRRQGFTPLFVVPSNVAAPELAGDPNLEGAIIPTQLAPWIGDTPALQEFRDAVAQFAPGREPSALLILGWLSGKLFEAAAGSMPEPPTSEALLEGLWALQGETLGGLTHPLTFPREGTAARTLCWGVAMIQGGAFVAPRGAELSCR